MKDQQPEALRLANYLHQHFDLMPTCEPFLAASELRSLHAENEALKQQISATHPPEQGLDAEAKRRLEIGTAVERACKDLPEGAGITISLERGAGMVEMIDWDGNEFDHFDEIEDFAERINTATDGAIAAFAAQVKQVGV